MICPECGKEYDGSGKYCKECTHNRKKAYLREYAKKLRNKNTAISVSRDDYAIVKNLANEWNCTVYEAMSIIIRSR